jgi:S-(hydroxymethyl)glutathione dehydrogenase / alcohol dehydrogenase
MPTDVSAALLHRSPGAATIECVTVDDPVGREVLVRTAAAGLCHSELHLIEGRLSKDLPCLLGHEAAGVVEAVGPDVTSVRPGDRVVTCLSVFCGACRNCLIGDTWLCEGKAATNRPPGSRPRVVQGDTAVQQFSNIGAFAPLMLVHENATVAVTPDLPLDRAALLGCGVVTGVGAVLNTARLAPGSTAVVVGCGGIGLNAVQGCVLAGAARIIAVDRVPLKLELARAFGATDVVDATATDPVEAVLELSGGGVDAAFEAIGRAATVQQCFAMLRRGGTAYVIGVMADGEEITLRGLDFLGARAVQGVYMGSNHFKVDLPRYAELYLQGRLKLDELISARLPLSAVNEGFDAMVRGEVARSVIVFD